MNSNEFHPRHLLRQWSGGTDYRGQQAAGRDSGGARRPGSAVTRISLGREIVSTESYLLSSVVGRTPVGFRPPRRPVCPLQAWPVASRESHFLGPAFERR